MARTFWVSAFIHGLLVGVLFFIPGLRRYVYVGDIQQVYLVKAPRVSFKKEEIFVQRRVAISTSPIEVESLKEKILERYSKRKEKKQKPQEVVKKRIEKKSVEPISKRKPSLLFPSNFPYTWYIEVLRDKIYTNWSPPSKFSILEEGTSATVSFRILKDGTIQRIRLKKSSKIEILDQSALEALEMLRLPPLPDNWNENCLDVTVRFRVEG